MPSRFRSLPFFLAGLLFLSLSGCFGSSDNGVLLTLGVKDTPVDGATSVMVDFEGIDLLSANGVQSISFPGGWPVDLLRYQGGNTAVLLHNLSIPAGDYQGVRLNINLAKSYLIASDGNQYPLTMPNGATSGVAGVMVSSAFTAIKGETAHYVVDFNLRDSITESGSGGTTTYTLNPSLRLIPVIKTGFIKGTVAPTLTVGGTPISASGCYPAVYVYSGTPATLGGFQSSVSGGAKPLTSTPLAFDSTSGNYVYNFAYMQPGTYTLAVTCAGNDQAGAASLAFSNAQTASVQTDYISPTNF